MDANKIINRYQSGETISSIARDTGCTIDKIRWMLTKAGVLVSRRKRSHDIPKKDVIELYQNDVPVKEIADKFNTSISPIVKILKESNTRKPNWAKGIPYTVYAELNDRDAFKSVCDKLISKKRIAEHYGICYDMVASLYKRHNIDNVSSSTVRSLLNQQKADVPLSKQTFEQLHLQENISLEKIAQMMGISVGFLREHVHKWNIDIHDTRLSPEFQQFSQLSDNEMQRIVNSFNVNELMQKYKVCHSTLKKCLDQKNITIPIRYRSAAEKEIEQFVSSIIPDSTIVVCDKSTINPYELDLFIPEYKLAIEYNGLYWHNELRKSNNYHLTKTKMCEEKGIRLIHIFEDEWRDQKQKCKDTLRHLLGKSEKGVYARNTTIREIPWKQAKDFLDKHHLLNAGSSGSYRIGAFDRDNNLIGVMVFGKSTSERSNEIELKRFVTNKKNNPGLGSKMFKYAINDKQYDRVIAFVDRRWFTGDVKDHIGFEKISETLPALWWTDNVHRLHRRAKTKKQLVTRFGKGKTKVEMMKHLGYVRIYDCGKLKLAWSRTK